MTHALQLSMEGEAFQEKGEGRVGLLLSHIEKMGGEMNLTPMEQKVVYLVCIGKCNYEIARLLYIAEDTVKKHISHIFRKFTVRNRVELLAKVFLLNIEI